MCSVTAVFNFAEQNEMLVVFWYSCCWEEASRSCSTCDNNIKGSHFTVR